MFKNIPCEKCSAEIVTQVGSFHFKSKLLGEVSIPNIEQHICVQCGNTLASLEELGKVREYVQLKECELIDSLPVGDFISLNEAAAILEVTKQAFSKNPKVKRGIIVSTKIDNKVLYLRKSVEHFKENGKDGRFVLSPRKKEIIYKEVPKYIFINQSHRPMGIDYVRGNFTFPLGGPYVNCEDFQSQYTKHYISGR
jgi:hypothetical protein